MPSSLSRRSLLAAALTALGTLPLLSRNAVLAAEGPTVGLDLGPAEPFSFERLVEQARRLAGQPYQPPFRPAPEIVEKIDYDTHGRLHFRRDHALFSHGGGVYPVTFFHLGQFFAKRVRMHVVANANAREIRYSSDYFDIPEDSVARGLPADAGFAGFRLHEARNREDWRTQDWVAFLGASYFRAIGALEQYGLSARGIAIDTAEPTGEEFPDFKAFYIEGAQTETDPVIVYALLDGPSLAGAYRFAIRRTEGVVMDIEKQIFLRSDVARLGIAPLTSMFWYGEHNRPFRFDWRPEVHDSDGLALWTRGGERIWRPLNNPDVTRVSSFLDENPRGFGLLQRDRNLEHYLDGVRYHRRSSLWVEPLGDWGRGAVELVEIPTDDEIHDNIVAFWRPERPATAGQALQFKYRLHWLADAPYPPASMAQVTATRIGRGGEPGKPRPQGVRKFVVEFAGPALDELRADQKPEAVVTASRGTVSLVSTERVPETRRWRAFFDLAAEGEAPVELRLYLRAGEQTLSETWLYQHLPALDR